MHSQIEEYAREPHQNGLARAGTRFQPATIDPAGHSITSGEKKWLVEEQFKSGVVGMWESTGRKAPVKTLMIRFNPEEDYVPWTTAQSRNCDHGPYGHTPGRTQRARDLVDSPCGDVDC